MGEGQLDQLTFTLPIEEEPIKEKQGVYVNRPEELSDRIIMRNKNGREFIFKKIYTDTDMILYSVYYDWIRLGLASISGDYFLMSTLNDEGIVVDNCFTKKSDQSTVDFIYDAFETITENYTFGEDQKKILKILRSPYNNIEDDEKKEKYEEDSVFIKIFLRILISIILIIGIGLILYNPNKAVGNIPMILILVSSLILNLIIKD
jgi:hypothetical protein